MPQKRRIVIAGAGDLGREVAGWIRDEDETIDIAFMDDQLAGSNDVDGFPMLGTIDEDNVLSQDGVLIAIANPMLRKTIAKKFQRIGKFVHDSCRIVGQLDAGDGCMLLPNSIVSVGARLGRGVVVNVLASIGHDVKVGDYCTLSSHVDLCGHVVVGERVFFGSGARVLPGLHIGDDAVIGAGAVVTRDVPDGETVFGTPARRVK